MTWGLRRFWGQGLAGNKPASGPPVDPMAGVAQDATSLKYVPGNSAQWTTVHAALGFGSAPAGAWGCQDASGGAVALVGSIPLVEEGARMDYQQTIAGWTRKAINTRGDGLISTNAALPDLATTSILLLGYVSMVDLGTTTGRIVLGTSAFLQAQTLLTNLPRLLTGAGNQIIATTPLSSNPRPVMLKYDTTSNIITFYTDVEKTSIATDTDPGGKGIVFTGNASPGFSYWLYTAMWTDIAAELSDAQIKLLLQRLGWTVLWT